MKFNFKRISAITGSLLIAGMSIATPLGAANYPQPFIKDGKADVAIVWGTNAATTDQTASVNIQDDLADRYQPTGGSVSVGGEAVNIGDLTGELKLNSSIESNLYDDDLPSILGSGTSNSIDYEQSLAIGTHRIAYGSLDDEDNYQVNVNLAEELRPVLYIDQTSGKLWTYTLEFDEAFDAIDAGNEKIVIAGKEFTIDPNLEKSDDLILYASTDTRIFDYQELQTITLNNNEFDIQVVGGRDLQIPEATVNINGKNHRVNAGNTISSGGEEFYINDIYMDTFGDVSSMSVEIFVGAQKIEMVKGTGVQDIKLDGDTIDSVKGYFTATTDNEDITSIVLEFTPSEADYDYDAEYQEYSYLEIGESITDPILGTINVVFESASQGFTEDKKLIEMRQSGDELRLSFENLAENEYTVSVLKNGELNILNGSDFESLDRDDRREKFVLNKIGSGDPITHIAEISDVSRTGVNISSITLSYGGSTEIVNVGDSIRRSSDDLVVCYGSNNGFQASGIANKEKFSIQTSSCLYDADTNLYDGGLDSIYAANDVLINLTALTGTNGTMSIIEDDNNVLVFNSSWVSIDDVYEIEYYSGAQGGEDDEGDYGYYLTEWGSYIETEADEDTWAKVWVPEEEVTYNVYVTSEVTQGSPDELGNIIVKDSEIASVDDKNLIVVGGSCINSVAADLLGGAYCSEEFTAETGVGPNQFLIKGIEGAYTTGKVALLVAGYEGPETRMAATYLTTQTVDTTKTYIGTSSTEASVVTESN